jgi:cytochrome c-type biogenesis protein CcmH
MIAYILTGVAGIAIGVLIMRLMQANVAAASPQTSELPKPLAHEEVNDVAESATALPAKIASLNRTQILLGSAGGVMAIAIALIAFRGDSKDGSVIAASPATTATAPTGSLGDVDTMIAKLAERLKTDTSDGEGFRMLGWSYVNTGRAADAVSAYTNAVRLLPNRADVHAGYGEAMVSVAKDVVTPEAKSQFDAAIKLDPKEPRARFFLALHKAQNGKEREALDEWIALSNSASPELPWQADLQQRAGKVAAKLGIDIGGKFTQKAKAPAAPKAAGPFMTTGPDSATVAAAEKLPASEQRSMIDGMVEGLAAKLQANPDDVDGWVKLIRSRTVLKDTAKAKDDLALARKAFASEPDKLGQINALAAELGL